MEKISLETSQHVVINYEPADIFERILAWLTDAIILGAYSFIISMIWGAIEVSGFTDSENAFWIPFLLIVLPTFLYYPVVETVWKGYTLGKKIVGIRVVKIDGSRPTLGSFVIRWLFRLLEVSIMAGSIAIVTILLNGKGQRLGDIVAKTTVIKDKKKTKLSDTIFEEIDESYEPHFSRDLDLADKEVRIIKQVLNSRKDYDYNTWFVMVTKTRKAIERKTGIEEPEMKSHEYLKAILEDYNKQFSE